MLRNVPVIRAIWTSLDKPQAAALGGAVCLITAALPALLFGEKGLALGFLCLLPFHAAPILGVLFGYVKLHDFFFSKYTVFWLSWFFSFSMVDVALEAGYLKGLWA